MSLNVKLISGLFCIKKDTELCYWKMNNSNKKDKPYSGLSLSKIYNTIYTTVTFSNSLLLQSQLKLP